jgi:hypothetical protein
MVEAGSGAARARHRGKAGEGEERLETRSPSSPTLTYALRIFADHDPRTSDTETKLRLVEELAAMGIGAAEWAAVIEHLLAAGWLEMEPNRYPPFPRITADGRTELVRRNQAG